MRVIGGTASGRRLKAPAGVRPTSDLVREAIFDTLEARGIDTTRVLDLYAGSGALGIEALSRGSEWCDFVERVKSCASVIHENLEATGLSERAKVYPIAIERVPQRLGGPYTLVLADPPYDDEAAFQHLASVARSDLLAPGAAVVVEHSSRREPPTELGPHQLRWTRRYGDTQVSIYRRGGSERDEEAAP